MVQCGQLATTYLQSVLLQKAREVQVTIEYKQYWWQFNLYENFYIDYLISITDCRPYAY